MRKEEILGIDVLIVEDEPGILDSLIFILKHAGLRIATASDGQTALKDLRALNPRMLMLDVMLPKISGFEILKRVRADSATQNLPVLMLTAKGQAQDKRTAEDLGANAFVTKPYSNKDVVDTVKRLLREREID